MKNATLLNGEPIEGEPQKKKVKKPKRKRLELLHSESFWERKIAEALKELKAEEKEMTEEKK